MLDAEEVRHTIVRLWVALYEDDHDRGRDLLLDCLRCLPASEQSALWRELPGVALSLSDTLSPRSGSTEPSQRGRLRSVRVPPPARLPIVQEIASVVPVADDRPTEPARHVTVWEQERDEAWEP